MHAAGFSRFTRLFAADGEVELRVRIFRLVCTLTTGLCLLVVAPLNSFQPLPMSVHVGNVVLALMSLFCLWESNRGRHHVAFFFVTMTVLLDLIWFWNAGSDGSVTHYYYPLLLCTVALFEGWRRWLLAVMVLLNVVGIHLLEHVRPELVTPFQTRNDRLLDLLTGIGCSFVALAAVTWIILSAYHREQQRVAGMLTELARHEANYRELFDSSSDALLVLSADGQVIEANENAGVLFGDGRDRLAGRTFASLAADLTGEPAARIALALQDRAQLFDARFKGAGSADIWAEVSLRAWGSAGGQRLVASIRDITSRRAAREALRLNEERLRLAMAASGLSWFELNVPTGEVVTSPEYARILGYDPQEFRGSLQGWMERIHPADRAGVVEAYQRNLRTGALTTFDYRLRTKDGRWKWVRSLAQVVERAPQGEPLRLMGTHADITDRKELEGQLLHRQRLEAVGTLASGVAHDLNNILTPLLMASSVLRDRVADPADRELLTRLDDGGRRGAAIVRQLLDFSRNLAENRVPVAPRHLIDDVVRFVRSTFPKEIAVKLALADVPGLIEVETNQLHQVLVNLCVNARDAMNGGGTITFSLDRVDVPMAETGNVGPHLVLSVADTGPGVPPEIREKIFDPFFTTKPVGQGTGLGLATVHGIVKAHHGFVRLECPPGAGAVFKVFLPARDQPAAAAAPPPSPPKAAAPPTAPLVLVVDDEPTIRLAAARYLQRMGCRVLEADGGAEAIQLIQQQPEATGVVVTDFSMPGMDGPTLVPRLRALKPGWHFIGMSGRDQSDRAAELAALGFAEILAKPYEAAELWQAVCRQLASGRSGEQ